jgi:lipopolysaccharide export system protein LptA
MIGAIAFSPIIPQNVQAQANQQGGSITVRSDIQEANSTTGIITAKGNVQINYPSQKLQATATQAEYFSKERRLVLTGNVFVLQDGNTIRAETLTYLLDEGRFIATPSTNKQVESTYIVTDENKTPDKK